MNVETIRPILDRYRPLITGGLLLILTILMLDARLAAREQHSIVVPPPHSAYHLPNAKLARFTTLGYHEAAADLSWLRTIIYFGEQATVRGRFEDFKKYVDLTIALDPRFRRIYHWAGVLMVYSRAKIRREMVEDSIHYLKLGAERFPGDGEMHYMLGFNLYFEYPPFLHDEPETKRAAKLEGIDHFKAALVSGEGPPWLGGMIANLMQKQGMNELAIVSLRDSLAFIEDPETREKVIERIRMLETETGTEGAAARWERFHKDWIESYPYLTMDMYLLVGPKPLFPPEAALEPTTDVQDALDVLDSLDVDEMSDEGQNSQERSHSGH